jgi:hypothetical protein
MPGTALLKKYASMMEGNRAEVVIATQKFVQITDKNKLFLLIEAAMLMYTMAHRLLRLRKDSSPGA